MRMQETAPLSDDRKRQIAGAAGFSCCICGVPLGSPGAGLTRYLWLPAYTADDAAPVCDNCDANMVNGLYRSPAGQQLVAAAIHRWLSAVAASAAARWNATPGRAASLLDDLGVRGAFLSVGAYDRLSSASLAVRHRLTDSRSPSIAASRLTLLSSESLRTYYQGGSTTAYISALESELGRVDGSVEFSAARNTARLALSRLYRSAEDSAREEHILDQFEHDVASLEDHAEWDFRFVSYRRHLDPYYGRLSSDLPAESGSDPTVIHMARAAILGEVGRSAAESGVTTAVPILRRAFAESWSAVHRRGMVMSALKLSHIHTLAGEAENAVRWWSTARRIGNVGRLTEHTVGRQRRRLLQAFGPDVFSEPLSDEGAVVTSPAES
jgi:hypothetical protein